jgi:excisionase family DNA binding protein
MPVNMGISTSAAATKLGVSIGTVRRWADMGYLPCFRTPGNQRRYDPAEIDKFIEQMRHKQEQAT